MTQKFIDLRSDTVTKPSKPMLEAMMNAEVGDDVFGEDPTINALEKKAATMFGMEAALYCSSGTQTNQIAIKVHTSPGTEIICDHTSHIYRFEGGGIGFNSGASVRLIHGDRGRIKASEVASEINNPHDYHVPTTSLVSIENTSNKGGGSCYDFNEIIKIKKVCAEHELKFHLDGARLFNALTETEESPKAYGEIFDSISICLSKGLGAPVGSLLLGSTEFIKKAHRIRKVFGGAMRQAGFIAAAGIYALDNNIKRLAEDHKKAQHIATVLSGLSYIEEVIPAETNILIFRIPDKISNKDFLQKLNQNGIKALGFGPQLIRFVTHLDFTDEMLVKTEDVLKHKMF